MLTSNYSRVIPESIMKFKHYMHLPNQVGYC